MPHVELACSWQEESDCSGVDGNIVAQLCNLPLHHTHHDLSQQAPTSNIRLTEVHDLNQQARATSHTIKFVRAQYSKSVSKINLTRLT
jgi:hypothetical protein